MEIIFFTEINLTLSQPEIVILYIWRCYCIHADFSEKALLGMYV